MTKEGKNAQKFAAFMSYAHADEGIAGRLHLALETYRLPKAFKGQDQHSLKPIFRDVADLTAHHSLSDKIRDAVAGSRCMIVLCSPAAKNSHWVNAEIRYFRELHGDDNIYSVMASGSPATAFPEALTEGGREPLAADISGDKAGFRLGVTQLAAAMLGIGLDDLVRRDERRRTRRFQTGMLASLVFSGVMAAATLTAVDARKEAEASRNDAEGLVEYMITDLKEKLEPVGRLDILDGVGERAVAYYDKQDIKKLSDDNLTRQARARHVLGQVAIDAGRMDDAQREVETAATLTREVLARNPDDPDAIFAHGQSEFWVGKFYFSQRKFDEALGPMQEYDRLGKILYSKNPDNFKYIMEAAWGANNLGTLAQKNRDQTIATKHLKDAAQFFEIANAKKPKDKSVLMELANTYSGLAYSNLAAGGFSDAKGFKKRELETLTSLTLDYPNDVNLQRELLISELDYLFDFFITESEPETMQRVQKLNALLKLVEFDINNTALRNTYLDYLLDITCRMIVMPEKRKPIYDQFFQNLSKNSNNLLESNLAQLYKMTIRIEDISHENTEQFLKDIVTRLHELAIDERLKTTYILMHLNYDYGDLDAVKEHAKRFLDTDRSLSSPDFPTLTLKRIYALDLLQQCAQSSELLEKLQNRMTHESINIDKHMCVY